MATSGKTLRVALIGAGGMGRRWAWAIGEARSVRLRVIVDSNLLKAEALAKEHQCEAFSDWRKVLQRDDIDAAVVVTPNKWLAPISRFALLHGKHVLCEKPGALDAREMKSVLQAVKKSKRCYMIGYNYRFFQGPRTAKKLFDQGVVGKVLFIRARHGFAGRKGYEKEWRHNKKMSGGGELIDQGSHLIDLARWFLGDVVRVHGNVANTFWRSKVEDNVFVLLASKKGQTASLHASWTQWDPMFSFEIYGEKGYIKVEGLGRKYGGKEKVVIGLRDPNLKKPPKEKVIECNPDADQALVRELKEFFSVVHTRRQPQPSAHDALEVLKIVERVYQSK